jgi:hypothetical protein
MSGDELEIRPKEVITAFLKILFQQLPGEAEENVKTLSQDSRRSKWPRCLRQVLSSAARTLGSQV